MKILITGATGFVGKKLIPLLKGHHDIWITTRNKKKAGEKFRDINIVEWDFKSPCPELESEKFEAIINLMGENIGGKRWSEEQKEILYNSRVTATQNLIKTLDTSNLSVFIQASAIGIYPSNTDEVMTEESRHAHQFIGKLCQDWEAQTHLLPDHVRKVILRFGVILGDEGALQKMLLPFKMGVGGQIGNGNQIMSWIHHYDVCQMINQALSDSRFTGAYNAVAPNTVSNKDLTQLISAKLKRPALFPVPPIMLRILFGEMSSIILDSQKIKSSKLDELNFNFKFNTMDSALDDLLK